MAIKAFWFAFTFLWCGSTSPAVSTRTSDPGSTLHPDYTIIVRGDAKYERSAELLQKYLRRGSRVRHGFEIIDRKTEIDRDTRLIIAVGLTRWTDREEIDNLWRDGFILKRRGRVVVICGGNGGDERGTFHGAVSFLDKLGIRFYMPGDLWTSIPERRQLQLPEKLDIRSEPFVKLSNFSGITPMPPHGREGLDWASRNAVLTRRGLAETHSHNMWQVFNPDKYAAQYPEIYPLVNGQRHIPSSPSDQNWNPCLSSEQTFKVARQETINYFTENPDHLYFSFGLQDSSVICDRDVVELQPYIEEFHQAFEGGNDITLVSTHGPPSEPTAREARRYAMSQLQWRFLNRLAASLENQLKDDQFIQGMAYGVANYPPSFNLHPNVLLYSQIHIHDNIQGMLDEPLNDGSYYLDQFATASRAYGNHEWYHGNRVPVPRIYCNYHADFLRHIQKLEPEYYLNHIEAYNNWGLDGPKLWVLAQLQWDPQRNVEQLWRQFAEDMFGPAARPVYYYFQTLRKFYIEQSISEEAGGSSHSRKWPVFGDDMWSRIFRRKPENLRLLALARRYLNQAFELVETRNQYQRLQLFSRTFRLTEYLYALGSSEEVTERQKQIIKNYYYQVIEPDQMTLYQQNQGFIEKVIEDIVR